MRKKSFVFYSEKVVRLLLIIFPLLFAIAFFFHGDYSGNITADYTEAVQAINIFFENIGLLQSPVTQAINEVFDDTLGWIQSNSIMLNYAVYIVHIIIIELAVRFLLFIPQFCLAIMDKYRHDIEE